MRIQPVIFGSLVLVVFLGIIFGFQSTGIWSISGKVDSSGNAIQPSTDDVESIKGWMTLEQISTTYKVPLEILLAQFNLPADTPASTPIKDLETEQFSVTNLRTWLESLSAPEEQESTPVATAAVPQATPTPTVVPLVVEPTFQPTEHIAPEKVVNAKTTFQNLLDWGVPVEVIKNIIGGELPPAGTVIKNYVTAKGLEFSPIKAALQVEVDKTK